MEDKRRGTIDSSPVFCALSGGYALKEARSSLDQRFFSLAVEDMHFGHIDDDVDRLANARIAARVELANHLLTAVLDIGEDLAAERLDHGDVSRDLGCLVHTARHEVSIVEILGADTK